MSKRTRSQERPGRPDERKDRSKTTAKPAAAQAPTPSDARPDQPPDAAVANPFPVMKCDENGRVSFVNEAALQLLHELGIPSSEPHRLLPPEHESQIRAVLDRRAGVVGQLHELGGRSLSVTFSPDPTRPECMILIDDVTDHRHADAEARRYASELQDIQTALVHSEKMASLGSLIAGVAHEINTPIGSINSNSDVALRALNKLREALNRASPQVQEDPAIKNAVEALQSVGEVNKTACERIVKIVRSLRNFARLHEGERKPANLHDELESTLTLVHHEIKNRIEVERDYGDVPEVECHPDQLNQVFLNILVNAAQAIEGNGKITIRTRTDGESVTLSFTDTGKGISPQDLPRIFDPGFTTKGIGVGSGLGLSICYKIVKEHGGRVDVQSELGKGTTFTVTLPLNAPGGARRPPGGNLKGQ